MLLFFLNFLYYYFLDGCDLHCSISTYLLQSDAHFLGNHSRQRQGWQLDTGDEITEQKKYKKKRQKQEVNHRKKKKAEVKKPWNRPGHIGGFHTEVAWHFH